MKNLGIKLTYDDQLKFKRYVRRTYKLGDIFYFDSIFGVNAETDRNIPGLYANGTLTWAEAIEILKKQFGFGG